MLIHELEPQSRDLVIQEASERTRLLWPYTPEGSLGHAVFVQFMKDMGKAKSAPKALKDWHGTNKHWWMDGFGVSQSYLWGKLNEWSFVGEGKDLPERSTYESLSVGTRVCRVCKMEHDITDFHKERTAPGGRLTKCKYCRRNELNRHNNNE